MLSKRSSSRLTSDFRSGASNLWRLELSGTQRLADLLAHLYWYCCPVLDADKHYWFGEDELTKLLRRGEGWLAGHPERELITGAI